MTEIRITPLSTVPHFRKTPGKQGDLYHDYSDAFFSLPPGYAIEVRAPDATDSEMNRLRAGIIHSIWVHANVKSGIVQSRRQGDTLWFFPAKVD